MYASGALLDLKLAQLDAKLARKLIWMLLEELSKGKYDSAKVKWF